MPDHRTIPNLTLAGRFLAAVLVASATASGAQQAAPHPRDRSEAVDVVRGLRRIVSPQGIDETRVVRIGGIDQWISIRGDDRRNPVLLVLHGGPGYVEAPLAWWYARGWEQYFTVVQWDQRGAGKTYLLTDPKTVAPTMTRERILADTEEMAAYVRRSLGKDRIFVWGHSWGSYLGLELARRHPDWLYAYLATGQVTNAPESERRGWAFALASARAGGNEQAVAELEAIAPYPPPGKPPSLAAVVTAHKWSDAYGGVLAWRRSEEDESRAARLSPDWTDAEAPHVYDGNEFSERYLLADLMNVDLSSVTEVKCPIILLEGRHDRTVNSDVAYAWFHRLRAPTKRFVWFENSAHEPEFEEPGRFLVALLRYARPLAEAAGDALPLSPGGSR